ncbi:MAG: hypothetical protein H0X62_00850 [Bacteroidetes bacterium]|nr:hypothetical protein [Bacteroidota bacterium]
MMACKKEESSILKSSSTSSALTGDYQLPDGEDGGAVISAFRDEVESFKLDSTYSGSDMEPTKALILMEALINYEYANFREITDETNYYSVYDEISFNILMDGTELSGDDILKKYVQLADGIEDLPSGHTLFLVDIELASTNSVSAFYVARRIFGSDTGDPEADAGAKFINDGLCSYSTNSSSLWKVITAAMNANAGIPQAYQIAHVQTFTAEWNTVTDGDLHYGNNPNVCIHPEWLTERAFEIRTNLINNNAPNYDILHSFVGARDKNYAIPYTQYSHFCSVITHKLYICC